ncbi:MAG: type II toxin-antitoxin system RelE/ParE family toxin [Rickettsiales bacterium]
MNYKLSEQAEADLIRIYQHGVRNYGEAKADQYYDAFFERFEEIAKNPYLYQSADYIHEGYRRCVCGVDSIFYRIVDDKVEIISILGRQDTGEIF